MNQEPRPHRNLLSTIIVPLYLEPGKGLVPKGSYPNNDFPYARPLNTCSTDHPPFQTALAFIAEQHRHSLGAVDEEPIWIHGHPSKTCFVRTTPPDYPVPTFTNSRFIDSRALPPHLEEACYVLGERLLTFLDIRKPPNPDR